jgi:hypothetical protein
MRMLNRFGLFLPLFVLATILVGLPTTALGREDGTNFSARLLGINETPSINTDGTASLRLQLNTTANTIDFTLTYQNLSGAPGAAHIHFAQERVAGGVMVFFCGGGGQPACPATTSGTVSGTIAAANVVAIPAQGITAGDMAAVMRAIRAGASYANMHTTNFPGGEIRGQIGRSGDRGDD